MVWNRRGTGEVMTMRCSSDEARGSKMTRATRSETLLAGVYGELRRRPSVGAAERVFALDPPVGKFSADPASYEAGSA